MRKKVIILFIGIFLLSLISLFLLSRLMTIKHLVVIGISNITDSQVKQAIGIKEGSSILYPSSKILYERLKKIPWIKDAVIRKDLNGTLTVYIKESTPVAIALYEKKAYLIDNEGRVLEDFSEKINNVKIFLPVLRDIDPFKNKETLVGAIELINFLSSKNMISSNDDIVLTGSNPDDLSLYVNQIELIFGKGDLETKLAKYSLIVEEIRKRGLRVQYIDLRFPEKVVVKTLE